MKEKKARKKGLSIIIPVLNEADNISVLVERIDISLQNTEYEYEIIIIDDHSEDKTASEVIKLQKQYPISFFVKQGSKGKAQSLLEGFSHAKYDVLCMIDSDLQYPPEAIPEMLSKIDNGHDVVLTTRSEVHTNAIRKFFSKTFNFVFCKVLHNLPYDVQSGLKIFKKEIIERTTLTPSAWSFDLEFILAAIDSGYKVTTQEIVFEKRRHGNSKINLVHSSIQIGLSALLLKLREPSIIPIHTEKSKKVGAGFHYKKTEFIHFSSLGVTESAVKTIMFHQTVFIAIILLIILNGLFLNWQLTLMILVGIITFLYFLDLLFNLLIIIRTFTKTREITVSDAEFAKIYDWPMYTILCPLYKEWAVVSHFVKSIDKIDYPKDKLQVMLLLEEDDKETIEHIKTMQIPSYFEIVVVPDTLPKTKPKACNYGLKKAKGEYVVIYDAEDMPDPKQLKKAVIAFQNADDRIVCIQAKLNYYNADQNLLTKLFTAEYTLWFDLILTGLQSLNAPIPLGGTSNHFKINELREVRGWDSFNVTEDCDLGIRLAKKGYYTAVLDSTTLEEANSSLPNWMNQRSRWIKGYIQTYLVHTRNMRDLLKKGFRKHFLTFHIIVGGKISSLFINPVMWLLTILYFAERTTPIGTEIEKLFPGPILYIGVMSFIAGNFLYLYYYMLACAKRKDYYLIKYIFLVPFYWIAMSIAAWKGLIQLIVKPHYWPKTKHGLHIQTIDTVFIPPKEVLVTNEANFVLKNFVVKGKEVFNSIGFLVIASVIANFLNFFYNGFLSRNLSITELGVLGLLNSFLFLAVLPLESLYSTLTYKTAFIFGKYNTPVIAFWSKVRKYSFWISTSLFVVWLLMIPMLAKFFNTTNYLPFLLFSPTWIFNTMLSIDSGFLTGNHSFKILALITVFEPLIKLITAYVLVSTGNQNLVYIAVPAGTIITSYFTYLFANRVKQKKNIKIDNRDLHFPVSYFSSILLLKFATVSFITFDVILAKRFLSPEDAGRYALIALVGKMIFFVGGLFNQFIVPLISREFGKKEGTRNSFLVILTASVISSFIAYLGVGLFGWFTAPILLGDKIIPVTHLLPVYGLGVWAFTITASIIAYYQVRKVYIFPLMSFALSFLQIVLLSEIHWSLDVIVYIMAAIGILNLLVAILCRVFYDVSVTVSLNIADFFNLFTPLPKKLYDDPSRLDILIFNWRDTKHVWAGGAEVYVQELGKKLIERGHKVTIFCGNDNKSKRFETVDGINVFRRGGFYTVYIWAFLYYVIKFRNKFDVIIDSENGIPFFTPIFVRKPIVLLIHHIHLEVFMQSLSKPLAYFACFLEGTLMPFVYRNTKVITVSKSTEKAVREIGFLEKNIAGIVHPGINHHEFIKKQKTKNPTILYLGRLQTYKSIDLLIKAMKEVILEVPKAKLLIAGFGETYEELQQLVEYLDIKDHVTFLGKVDDEVKRELLATSWVFVTPSAMEGWGISVIEANASGTPAIASDVPGLRDSVQDSHTGLLTPYGDTKTLSTTIQKVIKDTRLRNKLSKKAYEWSQIFSWDKSTDTLLQVIKNYES